MSSFNGYAVCLYGDLGSGKTTFTQGLAEGLHITERILSPTFVLMREYLTDNNTLYHIDLYRTNNNSALQIPELLTNPNAFVVIEWADKLGEKKPKKRFDIFFNTCDDNSHEIRMELHHEQ